MKASESLVVACPECSNVFRVKASLSGKRVKCPKCSHSNQVGKTNQEADEANDESDESPRIPWMLLGGGFGGAIALTFIAIFGFLWFRATSEVAVLKGQISDLQKTVATPAAPGEPNKQPVIPVKPIEDEKTKAALKALENENAQVKAKMLELKTDLSAAMAAAAADKEILVLDRGDLKANKLAIEIRSRVQLPEEKTWRWPDNMTRSSGRINFKWN
ncbi:MAG: hypothetical protein HY289_09985 [Planctomycetes bacterium]|nr:hypothetical protein [Planctomycetota bacterium]